LAAFGQAPDVGDLSGLASEAITKPTDKRSENSGATQPARFATFAPYPEDAARPNAEDPCYTEEWASYSYT
jgi:hypothetical protein